MTGSPDQHRPDDGRFDDTMMARALDLAQQARDMGEVPVGAVVFRTATGEVLGEGFNTRETERDPAGHAEFSAILRACRALGDWRLNDCTLCVTLEPCPMCAGLIVNARVGRVVFAATDPKAGACVSLFTLTTDPRLNHRVELIAGVRSDEASDLLREFFRQLRSRNRDG